ncbi:MAG: hypothetical protein ABSG53_05730 [Thermoguttaceae bacterium]
MFAKTWVPMSTCAAAIVLALAGHSVRAAAIPKIVLKNESIEYALSAEGRNLSFLAMALGKEYLVGPGQQAVVMLKKGGTSYSPTTCRFKDGKVAGEGTLVAEFAEARVVVTVGVRCAKRYLCFEIQSVDGPAVEEVSLLNLVLKTDQANAMSGVASDEDFAIAVRALNLQTIGTVGGKPVWLSAAASPRHRLAGAKVGLAAGPVSEIRQVLKEMLEKEGATRSPLGGPWALDAEQNRGSYVFADVSEKNVDDWIALAKLGGIQQIHFIGWEQTLGHYAPRKDAFPHGLAGLKAAVDKIHAAGLKAGMHTLTGAISPSDPWASPVPDPRLAKDATFTLAESIDGKSTVVPTAEKPGGLDTIWAYGGRGNVLQIGSELIQYDAIARTSPYGFTGCHRGAFGTNVLPHERGTPVHYLFVRYQTFQPDEDSTLIDDLAAVTAHVFNTCGFDMIYQDGSEGMAGGWYGMARMREAIFKKLARDALVEASAWGHYEWAFHSRFGAWDYPNWGLKRFVDAHCRANEDFRRTAFLPAQLGWWVILGPERDHPAETPDEFEYLCCKALAYDTPTSFEGVSVGGEPANSRQNEYMAMLGRYERLRLSGRCPAALREKLKTEQADFHMVEAADGSVDFIAIDYLAHKVTGLADGTDSWTVNNGRVAQPLKLRIDALYSVEPYDGPGGRVLAGFAAPGEFVAGEAADGVAQSFTLTAEPSKLGKPCARYSATSTRKTPQGAWSRVSKIFNPPLDLNQFDALGVWIYGDGRGELLNFQLTNPTQFWPTLDEHYVKVDFRGWRYFELLAKERDADQFADYLWPYHDISAVYRSPLIHDHVSALNLWFNRLPPGGEATCCLGPIKALRILKTRLTNPVVTVGGKNLVFPVTLQCGYSLEFASASNCKVFDERGKLIQKVHVPGPTPVLAAGNNQMKFRCEAAAGPSLRAKITVLSAGESAGRIPAGP